MDDDTLLSGLPHIARVVQEGEPRYTPMEASTAAGVPLERARRLWRAMGFADIADDERALSDRDLEMLRKVAAIFERGVADADLVLQMARVMGHALGRIAGAQAAAIRDQMEMLVREAENPEADTAFAVQSVDWALETMESFLVYMWRRHLLSAGARHAAEHDAAGAGEDAGTALTVGFADLVGFTAMSGEFAGAGLVRVIERFEDMAFDIVARNGARVVKTIGDEVMFVSEDPVAAALAGLDLAEACAADPDVPDVRVGLAYGRALTVSGDYFGPAVNLASRLVATAGAGSVVASDSLREVIERSDRVAWGLPRSRRLKGFGRMVMWVVRRPDREDAGWLERLADAIR